MKVQNRKTEYTVTLSEHEYEALRLLSERTRNSHMYVGGASEWPKYIEKIVGEEYAEAIMELFSFEDR